MTDRITNLFSIKYPIVQAGMIWCSGWKLASAVSNAGCLGLIGSGSMYPDVLQEHIRKCKSATTKPFGINVPLLYSQVDEVFRIIIQEKVNIVFTSAGNPLKWTSYLKDNGITVVHVVASVKSAIKCQEAGVDAIVAEGFEAGGHNGKEETTTFTLIPMVSEATNLPLIAAGGIATGKGMLAAMALGADGVQIGTRFVASVESSAHPAFKQKIIEATDGSTFLYLKKLAPVRLLKNKFSAQVADMEEQCAGIAQLKELLGSQRAKKGMFDGEAEEGELEIGQICGLVHNVKPAAEIISEIINEFKEAKRKLQKTEY